MHIVWNNGFNFSVYTDCNSTCDIETKFSWQQNNCQGIYCEKIPITSWSSLIGENLFFWNYSITSSHPVSYIMQQLLASQRFRLVVRLNWSFWMTSESKCCSWQASRTVYFPQHVRSSNKMPYFISKGFHILCMWDFCVVFHRLKRVRFTFDSTTVNNSPRQKRIKLVRNNSS